jgi:hypothetical protein
LKGIKVEQVQAAVGDAVVKIQFWKSIFHGMWD